MNWLRRLFQRVLQRNSEYTLLYQKVARRLGMTRANLRLATQENQYLRGRCQELRRSNYDMKVKLGLTGNGVSKVEGNRFIGGSFEHEKQYAAEG